MWNVTILAAAAPPQPAAAMVLIKVGYYLGVSAATGVGLALALLAARDGAVSAAVRRLVLPVAGVAVVTGLLNFVGQAAKAAKVGVARGFGGEVLADYVHAAPGHGQQVGPGAIGLIQLGGCAVVVVAMIALAVRGTRAAAWAVLALGVVTASIPNLPYGSAGVAGMAKDLLAMVHVLGVVLWVGGLVVLAGAGLLSRGSRDSADWHRAWARFGVVAMYAVGMLVVSGSWLAWSHVGTPGQLLTTPYGRYLAIKLLLVAGMLAIGTYNVRVLLPRIASARAAGDQATAARLAIRQFPVVVAVEAALATGVLVIVPFLAGSARTQAGWPAARPFDLTVFGAGVLLTALVAVVLWLGTRTPKPAPAPEFVEPASAR